MLLAVAGMLAAISVFGSAPHFADRNTFGRNAGYDDPYDQDALAVTTCAGRRRAGIRGRDGSVRSRRSAGDGGATALSLAVVCQTGPGSFYYRGERISDGANIELANAVRTSGGFDVTNPADGTRYEVRPQRLRIISNGHVDSSEPVLQYASATFSVARLRLVAARAEPLHRWHSLRSVCW